jgi:hypothetical protein
VSELKATGDEDIVMDRDDVTVKPIEREMCECGEPATHAVWLELRAIGRSQAIILACDYCANHYAQQLRGSLR